MEARSLSHGEPSRARQGLHFGACVVVGKGGGNRQHRRVDTKSCGNDKYGAGRCELVGQTLVFACTGVGGRAPAASRDREMIAFADMGTRARTGQENVCQISVHNPPRVPPPTSGAWSSPYASASLRGRRSQAYPGSADHLKYALHGDLVRGPCN